MQFTTRQTFPGDITNITFVIGKPNIFVSSQLVFV